MKTVLLLFLLLSSPIAHAQVPTSVAGTWKRTSTVMVDATGKSTDIDRMTAETIPCAREIRYTFQPNGTIGIVVPDACGTFKKQLEAMSAGGSWRVSGKTLTVTSTQPKFPTSTYQLTTAGNAMTWVLRYADNPKIPNPTKVRSLTITYVRL